MDDAVIKDMLHTLDNHLRLDRAEATDENMLGFRLGRFGTTTARLLVGRAIQIGLIEPSHEDVTYLTYKGVDGEYVDPTALEW